MKYIISFFNQYSLSLIHSITAITISYISIKFKNILLKHSNNKIKNEVITMVCRAINQLYPNESGTNKLNLAINNIQEILKEKNITVSNLELRMYIEGNVSLINNELITKKKYS